MEKKLKFQFATAKLKKILAGGLLVAGLGTGTSYVAHVSKETPTEKPIDKQDKKTDFSAVKLESFSDVEKLFDLSLNIIFAELVLEEVPIDVSYDDHGLFKGKKNTIGLGSTYSPIDVSDYDNPDTEWYHLASNQEIFSSRTANYEQMLRLAIGWGKYRSLTQNSRTGNFIKQKTVLERMFNELKGCSLRPNEFAALYCAAYNNEKNIKKLCPFVQQHYKDPIACANKIMQWYNTGAANSGLKTRCIFEALVYLNINDFCNAMMYMQTCPSKRVSCINVSGIIAKKLTLKNYETYSNNAKEKYLSVVYENGICTGEICSKTKEYFNNPLDFTAAMTKSLQDSYDSALALYNQGDYENALKKFIDLELRGASGSDLWNDIAVTYLNLNQYDNCIKYCKMVLKTTDYQEYSKACYNAGIAYEKKGDYKKAKGHFKVALKHYQKYGISSKSQPINYEEIYKNAILRITNTQKTIKQKSR